MQNSATELGSVVTVGGDKLERKLLLQNEIDCVRLEMVSGRSRDDLVVLVGEVKELIEDFGGKMKRRIGEDLIGLSW